MNRVTQQWIAPVVTTLEVLTILEALVFLSAALMHAGLPLPVGFTTLSEPTIPAAAIVEGTSALLFLVSAYALITRQTWSWGISLAAQIFALAGILLGIFSLAMGLGPRTATNDVSHIVMLILVDLGLTFLLAPQGKALPFARILVRVTGMVQLALGLIFWISDNDGVVPIHVINGLVFILALWAVAFLAARAGANPGLVALVFVWGLIIPVIGIAQMNILNNSAHWVIQVVHLLVGIAGIGLGERLATSVLKRETPAIRTEP